MMRTARPVADMALGEEIFGGESTSEEHQYAVWEEVAKVKYTSSWKLLAIGDVVGAVYDIQPSRYVDQEVAESLRCSHREDCKQRLHGGDLHDVASLFCRSSISMREEVIYRALVLESSEQLKKLARVRYLKVTVARLFRNLLQMQVNHRQ